MANDLVEYPGEHHVGDRNQEIFFIMKEAQVVIEQWRNHFNMIRPRSNSSIRVMLRYPGLPACHRRRLALRDQNFIWRSTTTICSALNRFSASEKLLWQSILSLRLAQKKARYIICTRILRYMPMSIDPADIHVTTPPMAGTLISFRV
ncbi:MAG: hypothetical protein J0H25_13315 [Rhizobiales bacterium]|nr:hypothetical protein [Hyphomicrobiales bacterium]